MKKILYESLSVKLLSQSKFFWVYWTIFFKNVLNISKEIYATGFYISQNIKIYGMTNANFLRTISMTSINLINWDLGSVHKFFLGPFRN